MKWPPRFGSSIKRLATAAGLFGALGSAPASAEPASCLSPSPSAWPAPARPYFMLLVDTSGSMISTVAGAAPSCAGYPATRMGHAKCAVSNTVKAFGGEVNFGISQFATFMTGCGSACYGNSSNNPQPGCDITCYNVELAQTGNICTGCGPIDNFADPTTARGGRVLVGMQVDAPTATSNLAQILQWVDNTCTSNLEVNNVPTDGPAYGLTPLNGSLRDMKRYFQTGWTSPDNAAVTFPTPLTAADPACRVVHVILLTDGDETCDSQSDAVSAAASLLAGVTLGSTTFSIKTDVINFAGGNQANTDAIALAGGTTSSYFATNEVQLSQALANIIAGAIKPETCDNLDNNCNGCTDEGFNHHCNTGQTCCNLGHAACITAYQASITAAMPTGDLTLLPCTTSAEQAIPASWLCYDPKEACDNADNNCNGVVDEGIVKCGNPAHCPTSEICNSVDDDCNGTIDEGVCNNCVPSPEVCDGCDNDCDGVVDDGVASVACGIPSPPSCAGTISCKPQQPAPFVGGCAAGAGWNACNNSVQAEVCDGVDNDCNGIIDDGIPPVTCVPAGTPPGLVYGGASQCKQGTLACGGVCQGFVGPTSEVCDGIDNDCDGQVDEVAFGVGQPCGINQPPCSPGATACVNGALVCQGGIGAGAEVCDGADNDCDGQVDEAPLADAPAANVNGCWGLPGNTCSFGLLTWGVPAGATCGGIGTLTPPCNNGTLACVGGGWVCQGSKAPGAEVCDGVDNDCNGLADDGAVAQVGQPCGSDVGLCDPGLITCTVGVLDCVGDVPPSPELCDGLDNDCDGTVDNGIAVGGLCAPAYDTVAYPGPRDAPPCQPGTLQCDGMGALVCIGGVGPGPEICDGIDNDCDGTLDEEGSAPDGIDGTANPFPPPVAAIGDPCGTAVGECVQGAYGCLNGLFACIGGQTTVSDEECDCLDNDCNGVTDDQTPGGSPLCSPGKSCVASGGLCQCAKPCSGELCPGGQKCAPVVSSETGEALGNFCVADEDALCGNCALKTVKDAQGTTLCAPAGTVLDGCVTPPVCDCKGQSGCQEPCFGVTCTGGLTCLQFGPGAGTCGEDGCFISPCPGCDKVCNEGLCVDDPCDAGSCPPDQVCKPTAGFAGFACVGSCAAVTCPGGQKCEEGQCVSTCSPACGAGQTCDVAASPPACVPDLCVGVNCYGDACCDPLTGFCGQCPCEGVHCPVDQACADGECITAEPTTGAGGGAAGATTGGPAGTTTAASGAGGSDRVWGLATGGGGCSCEAVGAPRGGLSGLALGALAAVVLARRRRRAEGEVSR